MLGGKLNLSREYKANLIASRPSRVSSVATKNNKLHRD